jgi:hypothetical protein
MQSTWEDASWQQSAHDWIDEQLASLGAARIGAIEQPHIRIWSTVMRVPTTRGVVWFKANMDGLRHEAAAVSLVSARAPELVPPPLAVDTSTGWMLMPDAGEQLRHVIARDRDLDRWLDVLTRYAELQIASTDDVSAHVAAGVPDLRGHRVVEGYERLVGELDVEQRFRDATRSLVELVDELAAYGIAETIQHDDLHDGQVFVKDGRHLVMDWGDACVSHPFFTLSVTLEGVIAWGLDDVEDSVDLAPFRDAYLEPFSKRYGGDVAAAVDVACRVGWACRAVNGHVPGDDGPTRTRLKMFLDGRP